MTTNAAYQLESVTAQAAGATFTGATRDAYGVGTQGAVSPWAFFVSSVYTDQTATAYIDMSSDGTTWIIAAVLPIAASTPATISAPVLAQFARVRVVNGATAQTTFAVRSGFAATGASLSSQAGVSSTESTLVAPWYMQAARGLVPGASVVNIYGYQPSVGTTFIPVWENATTYTYPGSATTMLLYSSSGSDTAVSVLIQGLDASYNILTETLVLTNGTTGVTTANSYLRINGISVTGSNNAVGTIYLSNAGKTTTYAQINAGYGKNQAMVYTVPNGYTFYLTRSNAYSNQVGNVSSAYCTYRVYTQSNGLVQVVLQAPFTNLYGTLRVAPRGYAQKTDIQWQANTPSSTAAVGIGVEGVLISNTAA